MNGSYSPEERFWPKVNKTDTCWLWTGWTRRGYGRFSIHGRRVTAHRYAYESLVGPIPEGMTLDHLCRVRNCVNPDHLEPVPGRENTLRGEGFAAKNARKTYCCHGHEFTPENTYRRPGHESRYCRKCMARRTREWEAKRKVAHAY